jgi:RHS repeat-associated protein
VATYAGITETTMYVAGILEKVTRSDTGITQYRHYIRAGSGATALYSRRSSGIDSTYYITRDHLGSASAITDATGAVLIQESFDAFGQRRGANWSGARSSNDWNQIAATTRRGFTDHEHLDILNLIHMNGRVYDPALGRFTSADPFRGGGRGRRRRRSADRWVHEHPTHGVSRGDCGW